MELVAIPLFVVLALILVPLFVRLLVHSEHATEITTRSSFCGSQLSIEHPENAAEAVPALCRSQRLA